MIKNKSILDVVRLYSVSAKIMAVYITISACTNNMSQ
jgi:hypothetical protein